ncbi:hypothetical protein Tco_0927551 [Tanacetum coccineum]
MRNFPGLPSFSGSFFRITAEQFTLTGTDISKITRKQSKTDKHGHGKRKSTKEAKDSKPKPRKVNSQSTMVNLQGRRTRVQDHHIIKQAHWSNPTRRMPRQCEETYKELIFTLNLHSEGAHKCHITDCQAGNQCVYKLDPTNIIRDPIIEGIQGVWICQKLQEISQERTQERMNDQEAKDLKAEAREIMPQPSTVNHKKPRSTKPPTPLLYKHEG